MSERAALTKTSENKGKNPVAAKPKENFYESMDSPVEQIFHLQRTIGNQAVQRLLKSGTIQAKLKIGQPNDKYEQEADRVADRVMRMPEQEGSLVNGHWSLGKKVTPLIQRQEQPEEEEEKNQEEEEQIQTKPIADQITPLVQRQVDTEEEEEKIQTKPITEHTTPIIQGQVDNSGGTESKTGSDSDKTAAQGLIVEDSTTELGPGQMKKSQFLAQLQAAVYSTVESALEGTGYTAEDCPYIKYWFLFYRFKNSQYIERAVHKYAPETSRAVSAKDYISIITVRVRSAARIWAKTGKITGVPKDIPTGMRGTGLIGGLVSKIGSIFFKARSGGPKNVDNLQTIHAKLGSGRPLDSGVSSRIGTAFGQDFSHVRIHTDAQAAQLSNDLNARAFTIGKDVAFASGEYRPGTLIGDALIAHELAHVVQQGGGSTSSAPMKKGEDENSALEKDADMSALSAVLSLWEMAKVGLNKKVKKIVPAIRSGLNLSRCKTCHEKEQMFKDIHVFVLSGSMVDYKSEVNDASKIWTKQANITLKPTYHPMFNDKKTRKLIGTEPGEDTTIISELVLDYDPSPSGTTEMSNLREIKFNKAGSNIAVFFVPKFKYIGPAAVDPLITNRIIYIGGRKCQSGFTLAHEVGHLLLGRGHKNWSSPLMKGKGCNVYVTDLECRMARGEDKAWKEYSKKGCN